MNTREKPRSNGERGRKSASVKRRGRCRGEEHSSPCAGHEVYKSERFKKAHDWVYRALQREGASAATLQSFQECGQWPVVIDFKNSEVVDVRVGQCRVRGCPYCACILANRRRERLARVVAEREAAGGRFSLLTVTICHCAEDKLHDLLKILCKALRFLTQSGFFKKHVRGYFRSIEITKRNGNGYHPHCHFVIESAYMKLPELIACWKRCVRKAGGRDVEDQSVDLKGLANGVNGIEQAIGYAVKAGKAIGYAVKAAELLEFSLDEIVEIRKATKDKHLVQSCRAWGRRAKQLEDEANCKEETQRAVEGIERVNLVALARGLRACEQFSVSEGLALCNHMIRKKFEGAGLRWLVESLQVVRTVFADRWRAAKAAKPGPAVHLVECGGNRYVVNKPPCVRNAEANANRIPGLRRNRSKGGARPSKEA